MEDGSWDAPAGTRLLWTEAGIIEIVTDPAVDLVVFAGSGRSGFRPLLAAIAAGKQIALANKEALVMAGALVTSAARRAGITVRPVDSEHSAIWQCLQGELPTAVRSLTLTASGGPFRAWSAERLATARADDALQHPTWQMGAKITIDSATLMNKGLEVIEAHWLFSLPYAQIDVMVHPQSIVHALVTFDDGAMKAQLGTPDMRTPIQYALSWPDRWASCHADTVDLPRLGRLDFETPDVDRFPCLHLARKAGEAGQTFPTVLCAADDVAVAAFLRNDIPFAAIAETVDAVLQCHMPCAEPDVEAIADADGWARHAAASFLARR